MRGIKPNGDTGFRFECAYDEAGVKIIEDKGARYFVLLTIR